MKKSTISKKKNTEKKLAVLLAGSLVTCALGTDVTSAVTTDNTIAKVSSKEIAENTPNVPIQTFRFDKSNPKDLVINNVTFGNETLEEFRISQTPIDTSDFIFGKDSITIPYKHLTDLNLEPGNYSTLIKFTDNYLFVNYFMLEVVDSNTVVEPPVIKPPVVEPPTDDKEEVISKPTIRTQYLNYDLNSLEDLVVEDVKFDGTNLRYIYINGKLIPASNLEIGTDTITIPVTVLKKLNVIPGNYTVSFKFENGTVLDNVEITFKNSSISDTKPDDTITDSPTDKDEDDNNNAGDSVDKDDTTVDNPGDKTEDNYVFDVYNPTAIEIPNLIPEGTKVESITINNKAVAVVYPTLRNTTNMPVVYVYDNKIVIPAETLVYVGLENKNYEIALTLEDGQTITKNISIDVVDSSINTEKPVTPPTTDKDETIDNSNKVTSSNTNSTIENNNSTSKVESITNTTNNTKKEKITKSDSPKTGTVATTGLAGSLLAAVTGMFATRKKSNLI